MFTSRVRNLPLFGRLHEALSLLHKIRPWKNQILLTRSGFTVAVVMGELEANISCAPNSMHLPVRMAETVAGAGISFFGEIKIFGLFCIFDITKMYWQKMGKREAGIIAPDDLARM